MMPSHYDTQVVIEYQTLDIDPVYGTRTGSWLPLETEGAPPVAVKYWAELADVMPSRGVAEIVASGIKQNTETVRMRMRWRADINSAMRVRAFRASGEEVVYQIVAGPVEIGSRQDRLEMMLQRYTTGAGVS